MVTLHTDEIKDVWGYNLDEEMEKIRNLVDDYNYIAMDTEFPGIVTRPVGNFRSTSDYHYQTLRLNVDQLKIIQLGLTFSDSEGNLAKPTCTWQFNFKFSLSEDMYAQDSIDLLSRSGIEFKKNEANGIDILDFGEQLMSSGIVLNDNIKWISFHSGYDFGYLLKSLTCTVLPLDEADFFGLARTYFPCIYDIKYIMKSCKNLKGGLSELADDLDIKRIGPQHQAGSDSLLTSTTFFKMRKMFFENQLDDSKYLNILYGLSSFGPDGTPTNIHTGAGNNPPPQLSNSGSTNYGYSPLSQQNNPNNIPNYNSTNPASQNQPTYYNNYPTTPTRYHNSSGPYSPTGNNLSLSQTNTPSKNNSNDYYHKKS
ncbi:hypothetical protein ACTFIV_003805 [Dictyostelium citrinum]